MIQQDPAAGERVGLGGGGAGRRPGGCDQEPGVRCRARTRGSPGGKASVPGDCGRKARGEEVPHPVLSELGAPGVLANYINISKFIYVQVA